MWKTAIARNMVRPLLERAGTMFAAYLIARGIDSDAAAQLVNGLIAAAFVLLDLVTSAVNRQRDETRLLNEIGSLYQREAD